MFSFICINYTGWWCLWPINPCGIFNAKSYLCLCIKYIICPLSYISFRHRAAACRFELVNLPLHVHRSTSLMSSSLLLQQCPACLIRLTLIVFVMDDRWPYSCCFVGSCFQDLFNFARSILVQLLSVFFSIRSVSVHVVHPYSSIDTTAAWKKMRFVCTQLDDSKY